MIDKLSYLLRVITDNPKPDVVSINLTPYCNQHCKYCEIGNGKVHPTKELLNKEDVMWIIDQMVENGMSLISIGGGEPLLVPWIWDIILYANAKGIKTEIITNGMLIPELTSEQIGILKLTSNMSISIDTADSEVQDYIRGTKGAFLKQTEGMKVLHKNGIPFMIATVITNCNYNKLLDLVEFSDLNGARFVKFQPLWGGSNFPDVDGVGKESLVVHSTNVVKLITQLYRVVHYEKTHPIQTNASDCLTWIGKFMNGQGLLPLYKSFINKYRCHTIHFLVTINYYGDMLPCNYLKPTANIKARGSLIQLWNGVCSDARNTFKKGWYFPECRGCTSSFEMSLLCSGIRYPISNYMILPKLFVMAKRMLKKQAVSK